MRPVTFRIPFATTDILLGSAAQPLPMIGGDPSKRMFQYALPKRQEPTR
jgi:hypothetical protein